MKQHTVGQGECVSSIGCDNGLFWETIWNDPGNADLKKKRKDPNVLQPGDVIVIPDKRIKTEEIAIDKRHSFKLKGVPAKLSLHLLYGGEPRKNEPFTLEVDGNKFQGTTGGKGEVEVSIPPGAKSGTLIVGEGDRRTEYQLQLGLLDPADEISGAQGRLANLGFFSGDIDGALSDETVDAIKAFQASEGLTVTGKLDADTHQKLQDSHESK